MHVSTTARKQGFNVSLNGYRGCCALVVFLYHAAQAHVVEPVTVLGNAGTYFLSSLRFGVEMFFMISGFVILGSLLRHASIAGFLRDRFIRIYSAWAPALIALSVVLAAFRAKMFADVTPAEGLGLFVANLFLLPPIVPVPLVHWGSWSLTYEWVFYLAAACGLLLARRHYAARWPMILWCVLTALFVCLYPRSTFFLTGVIVFARRDWFEQRRKWLGFPILSLCVFLIAWRMTRADEAALSDTLFDFVLDGRVLPAMIAFVAALHMFASVCLGASRQIAFLGTRPFQFLGNISYSFYLWHLLIMSSVKRVITPYVVPKVGLGVGFALFVLISFGIAVAVSWASWQLFEVRLAGWMRRVLTPAAAQTKELQSTRAA
jgi:peptidoglycan/LPS O-acetylase OafA/YrhL